MSQLIDVSGGEVAYVTARVTAHQGRPLDDTTWQVGLGGYTRVEHPTSWQPADLVEPVTGSVAMVSLLVHSTSQIGAHRYLWVLPAGLPPHLRYRAGLNSVDIV